MSRPAGDAPDPWTVPGLGVEARAAAFTDDPAIAAAVAAALRAAIEDAALVAEAMAFDAVAARIRRLKGTA